MFVLPAVGSLALLAAAVIAAELLHRRDDDLGADEAVPDRFSVTAPIVAAGALVLGPWPALLVGAAGSLSVRRLAGDPWRESIVRALSLGLAGFAGGYAYILSGSSTGSVVLPDDLLGLAILGMAFSAVKTLVNRVAARATVIETDLLAAGAEVSLGAALAIAAESNLWYSASSSPWLILVERLIGPDRIRREVAAALGPSRTSSTSATVRRLANHSASRRACASWQRRSGSHGDVRRLWWAGRLHDLGKVSVDAAALRKSGLLNTHDWEAMRRAPRLSARLLQRFRFAASRRTPWSTTANASTGSGYTAPTEATSRSRPIS